MSATLYEDEVMHWSNQNKNTENLTTLRPLEKFVIILAMKDMNAAKLAVDDVALFTGITTDLFPTTTIPTMDYSYMTEYIIKEAIGLNLQPTTNLLTKVIELYETKNSRHSTMIIGESNSGKSVTWKTLHNTITAMKKHGKFGFEAVHVYPINPKALSLGELYGEYNLKTGEWFDGVIPAIMRKTCSDESFDEKWILFDGPIDALWIENMNSVMDDNRILTLVNNERIIMPKQVSLLFEVQDLAVASPATVSRAGMVYNDYQQLGWQPFVNSWLQNYPNAPEFVEEMKKLFHQFVDELLIFKKEKCSETIPIPELNAVESLCKLLTIFATAENGVELTTNREEFNFLCKILFLFCMIWSLCGSVDEVGRERIDNYIRELEGAFPLQDTVYEYYVDVRHCRFISWEEKLPLGWRYQSEMPFFKIAVPTVDTIRYEYLAKNLLENNQPVLLLGPIGAGKTSIAQGVLQSFNQTKHSCLTINMSSQTSSHQVQEIIESKLEKRTRLTYIPAAGKILVTFMDDFNMPMKDTYGSQPPLQLIRQFIDYQFWYDRQNQNRMYIQKINLIAAMGPPGGGRNTITERLLTKFSSINITFPTDKQILRIYTILLNQHLFDFHPEVKGITDEITLSTLQIYKNMTQIMLPTPLKIHYMFNLRDISKVFQGLLRSHKDYQYSRSTFLRLWVHETFRAFNDRLITERDRECFIAQMNDQLDKYFELPFHHLCPEKRSPIFGNFMNPWNIYEDLSDTAAVRRFIGMQMDEYNTFTGVVKLDLILFIDAIEHICRIIRVISQPNGHMLLVGIGGNGRRSLSRLAGYISELKSFHIEVTKRYGVPEFREDMKRLYSQVGVDNIPTCFLLNDTQVVVEHFLEIINSMLGTGEVTNLYNLNEMEDIRNRLTTATSKSGISPTLESVYLVLINRLRVNLRMILCMSPVGDKFRNRLRQYPSLINCTTIDWFLPWPKDALLEISNKYLLDLNLISTITGEDKPRRSEAETPILPLQERMRYSISSSFALLHDSAVQHSAKMLTEMNRHNYVTPSHFLELVLRYKKMLISKRRTLVEQSAKLRCGLFKIDDAKEKVSDMAKELEIMQEQVLQSTKNCERFLLNIVNQKRDTDEAEKSIKIRSAKITEESKECKRLEEIARADLVSVEPALEEATKALDTLNKKDLAEIKSFARPPPKLEIVMAAIMILKNSEPTWSESKKQLGDVNFLTSLRNFDKDHITDATLKRIGKYTSNPEFDPEKVGQVSIAAKSLAMWVVAMENYGKLYRIIAPKREKLASALESLHEKENALATAVAQLTTLQEELKRLQTNYDEKMNEKEYLIRLAEELTLKLKRAAMLVEGLSGERIRWEKTLEILSQLYERLHGDCLICSGYLSYFGPFTSIYRNEMIKIWVNEVTTTGIPFSDNFDIAAFLSDSTTIREWNIQGLPSDSFSTENGIIISLAIRWPLIIDPQCQAVKWIKNMEFGNGLQVIDFGSLDFVATLERSLLLGTPVLLENVGETLDPVLNPILHKSLVKLGDSSVMKFNDKMIGYNDKFRFFITTKLPNPHYSPEISTKTTLCNFAIKEQGLEALLLGIVVRREKPNLEEQKDTLVLTIAKGKRTLRELEEKILQLLTVASGPLLEDLDLLNTLQSAKVTSVAVEESLITSVKTEQEIDKARAAYRTCSQRAATLFFVLKDMSHVDPMYQFSLDSYIVLFKISIDKSPKRDNPNERNDILNDYHTYAVYQNTCRGLFEKDKLLFSFNMCWKILEARGETIPLEYDFLLKGGTALERENQPDKPVNWVTRETWDNLTELDKLSGFHGVAASFEQLSRDWYNWYINTEPETKSLPGEWEANLNEFQKMLVIRSCRLDRMTVCITSFVMHNLGERFVEPPVLDIRAAFKDSIPETPLIFILSSGVDPSSPLLQLAESLGMSHKFMTLSLGQGQSPIARGLIQKGAKEGAWIFLTNCHLSLSWMPELEKIIEGLADDKATHPEFRLWLSSSPSREFPISILQASVKMTTEPPKGLKSNMKLLYGSITEDQFNVCKAAMKYKKLLFTLVFFHSILLERRKFQQLGWNIIYNFNNSDFEVSEKLLRIYLDEYPETPWDSLKYLIAGVCYGGHITDDWDRRLLMTYVQQYFTEDAIFLPHYRLSSLPTYYVPKDGSFQSYFDFITMLPNTDEPEAFGQHINADITSSILEAQSLFNTLMSMSLQTQVASSEKSTKEDTVIQVVINMKGRLPEGINYENTKKLIGSRKKPLDVVLLQEISRYNNLLMRTKSSLNDLERGIKGLVVMSEALEEIFMYVYDGRVPPAWLTSYPSLKPLGSWTCDLVSRIEHFAKWAETTHPPLLFWLGAYTFPTSFLTAVLQTSARLWNISIDSFSWSFAVLDENAIANRPPSDGVFIRSIFLEGAGWDRKRGTLTEPAPMQLIYEMPVIHFRPIEQHNKKSKGLYDCPCYYCPVRAETTNNSGFVVTVNLDSGYQTPEFWIKRATALLLTLAT
ncbi:dynein heavy chain 2, axonemal [Fopius arisanus]|uniref:Dynein heavy chain 2, axonemal n=1 Tax=Fopius arisanus TaxID=64838 RepID=A0A9R1U6U9_9HYME|nr:PREDICTED: dynein heavy chain 2, axonemal [Fopius arisanus]